MPQEESAFESLIWESLKERYDEALEQGIDEAIHGDRTGRLVGIIGGAVPHMIYPQPGSNAEHILEYVKLNPGATKTSIIRALDMNPSPTKTCLEALEKKGLIVDLMDDNGHHHYTAKTPAL